MAITRKMPNFAAVNTKARRKLAAWGLLAVFVPMLIIASLHVHSSAEGIAASTCAECVHHHCGGHLGQQTPSLHACVLCQFLTLPMMATVVAAIILYKKVSKILFAQRKSVVHLDGCGIISLRAPPTVLI